MATTIIRKYLFAILVGFALIFIVAALIFYSWGIGYLVTMVNEANNRQPANMQSSQFDLNDAAKLDYRGTLQQ